MLAARSSARNHRTDEAVGDAELKRVGGTELTGSRKVNFVVKPSTSLSMVPKKGQVVARPQFCLHVQGRPDVGPQWRSAGDRRRRTSA
jgi:hypothetical protein